MDEGLMEVMGNLQSSTDLFLAKHNMAGFKAHAISQHLRTAYEWVLSGQFTRAQIEIDLANQEMRVAKNLYS